MKVHIYKYRQKSDTEIFNYFTKPVWVDYICVNRILESSFPQFTEEYTDEEDITIFKSGYFTLTLSLLEGTKSINGKEIYEFLYEPNPYKYLIIVEVASGRTYSGILDTKIEVEKTFADNKYEIRVSAIGIEKETTDYLKMKGAQYVVGQYYNVSFEDYYLPIHFNHCIDSDVLRVRSQLNLVENYGVRVMVCGLLHDYIIHENSEQFGLWDAFKTFVNLLGCRWRVEVRNINDYYPEFEIILYSRKSGINKIPIRQISRIEGLCTQTYRYVFIATARTAYATGGDGVYYYYGLLLDSYGNFYIADVATNQGDARRFALDKYGNFKYINSNGQVESFIYDEIFKVEMPLFNISYKEPHNGSNMYGPFSRCLYDSYENPDLYRNFNILRLITKPNYQHYLLNIKKTLKTKVAYSEDSLLRVGSIIDDNNIQYCCDRLSEINYNEGTALGEFTET